MQFSAFAYLASAIAATFGVTIESILIDISTIKERLTSLDGAINAYPMTSESMDDAVVSPLGRVQAENGWVTRWFREYTITQRIRAQPLSRPSRT
jgi:NADH:ubiquinone oxidoreductase subunit E